MLGLNISSVRVGVTSLRVLGHALRQVACLSSSSSSSSSAAAPLPLSSSRLIVERTKAPREHPALDGIKFGHNFSDHMLEADWTATGGWEAPRIIPYGPLALSPAASSLHYGLQCFEGMKAYIDSANRIRMFRPMMNMQRINRSAERLYLPTFDGEQYLECIRELLRIDKAWIPRRPGYSMYIRPTLISTESILGVGPARHAKLYTILSPVGPYYPTGFAPVKLFADLQHVRAWPGGTGDVKCGGNYALGIGPAIAAAAKGYSQILWLFGENHQVTEVGTMNQFFLWKRRDGVTELVTAPLDGTILPGVTRDSMLKLARQWNEFEVVERHYTIHEVVDAIKEGRMLEAFGAGTAAIVSPVKAISYDGVEYAIPLNPAAPERNIGPVTERFANTLMDIQYGRVEHEWSEIVKE